MAGRGGLRALRERFGMHEWAPPTVGASYKEIRWLHCVGALRDTRVCLMYT